MQAKLNLAEILKSGCTTALIDGGGYSRTEAEIAGKMGMRAYVGAPVRAGDRYEEDSIWYSPDGHSVACEFNEKGRIRQDRRSEQLISDIDGTYDEEFTPYGPTQTMYCTPGYAQGSKKKSGQDGENG